jgi:hypothetical protein
MPVAHHHAKGINAGAVLDFISEIAGFSPVLFCCHQL